MIFFYDSEINRYLFLIFIFFSTKQLRSNDMFYWIKFGFMINPINKKFSFGITLL